MDKDKLRKKARKIRLFLTDVDGVLTNGSLIYGDNGMEAKVFNVTDGVGMILLRFAGIKTGIITAKYSSTTEKRAKEMCVTELYQGVLNKGDVLDKLLKKYKLIAEEIAYIGDDLADIPLLKEVGLPVTVPNAPAEVKSMVIYITEQPGGKGAVREVATFILKSQGKHKKAIKDFFEQIK
ncbi:MAG: HAD hydrolase family protein [Candidatus Omnitrophica bacterium]|nr:HAD hydrolase family protein [Candidatus Omnitrophota bacterium]